MKNIPLNAQLFSPPPLIVQFEQGDYNAYGQLYSGYVSISFLRVGFDTKITEATSIKVNDIEYVGLETPSFSWTEQINNNNDWINIPIFKNDNYNIKVIIRGSEYRDSLLVTKIETEIASTKTLRKKNSTSVLRGSVINSLEDENDEVNAPSIAAVKEKIRNIIESGDGYIKYSDGTMICYGEYTGTSELFDYFGWCIRTAENINITFKKEFLSAPMVTITPRYNSYIFSIAINQISATGFKFTGLKPSGARSSNYINMNYMAIGKWK